MRNVLPLRRLTVRPCAARGRICNMCGEAGPAIVPLDKDFVQVLAIVREGIGEMPPVGPSTVSDEDIRLVVDYLKSIRPLGDFGLSA